MLVLRKLKSYIVETIQFSFYKFHNRYSMNYDYIGLFIIQYNDLKYIYSYNGYISYAVHYMLKDPKSYYSLKFSIYPEPHIVKIYNFDSYKRDFSDLKYINCQVVRR
jgi:hypothetical protein